MRTVAAQYPRDHHGFIRQCAWCRRVADERGAFGLAAASLLKGRRITHGCCEPCLERLVDQAKRLTVSRATAAAVA